MFCVTYSTQAWNVDRNVNDVGVVAITNITNVHSDSRNLLSIDMCESDGDVDSAIARSDDSDRNESVAMTDANFTFSDDEL